MKNKFKELCQNLIDAIDEHYKQFPESEANADEFWQEYSESSYFKAIEDIRLELEKSKK